MCADAERGADAVRIAAERRPDIALLDLAAGELEAVVGIASASPDTLTVLLAAGVEPQRAGAALRAGARGYVLKSEGIGGLLHAIREVRGGAVYLSPSLAPALVEASLGPASAGGALTPRQREVLRLVAEGRSTKQVAQALGVSIKTADSHRTRVMQKLAVHETAGLVRHAIRLGLVEP